MKLNLRMLLVLRIINLEVLNMKKKNLCLQVSLYVIRIYMCMSYLNVILWALFLTCALVSIMQERLGIEL